MSLILAIDLGKYNSVFCGLEPAALHGRPGGPERFLGRLGEPRGVNPRILRGQLPLRASAGADPGEVFGPAAA